MKNFTFNLKNLFAVSAICLFMISCSKNNSPLPTYSIYGLWTGTLQDSVSGPQLYSFTIDSSGGVSFSAVAVGVLHEGNGHWILKDSTFTCSIITTAGISGNIGVTQNMNMKFDKYKGTLKGTWMNTTTYKDYGTISLTKAQ